MIGFVVAFVFFVNLKVVATNEQAVFDVDVVVIGSGISGISAASILAQNGKSVALVEQCYNIGGSLQTFTRIGVSGKTYYFEPGMHVITDEPKQFEEISGLNITINPFGKIIDLVYPGRTSDPVVLPLGVDNAHEVLAQKFPEEAAGLDKYFEIIKTTNNYTYTLTELIDEVTTNSELKYMLSYMKECKSFIPFPVPEYTQLWTTTFGGNGASFPAGSSERIINGALNMIKKNGNNKIYPNCKALKLDVSKIDGKVEGISTSCGYFRTKIVVSSMGAKSTFSEDFVDRYFLEKYGYLKKTEDLDYGFSAMFFFMGFNVSSEILGMTRANIWYSDFSPDTMENDVNYNMTRAYCSCLSCRNPEYHPKDTTNFFCSIRMTYDWFEKWKDSKSHERPEDYYTFKKKFQDQAVEWTNEVFPGSKDYLDVIVTSSPLTIRDYLNHPRGSLYQAQLNYDDFEWLKMETKIEGLYMTGQDLNGGSIQLNMASGIDVANLILKK